MRPLRVFWGAVLVSAALAAGFLVTSGSGQQPTSFARVFDRRCRGGCTDTALLRVLPGGPTATQIATGTLTGSKGQSITLTRASNKTCTRADGTVTILSSNAPCVESAGLLIEGASTNVSIRSQEFDNAAWTKSTVTVTADQAVAPDGTTTGDQLSFASGASLITGTSAVATASIYTAYVWLAPVSGAGKINLVIRDTTAGTDLATYSGATLNAGWQIVSVTLATAATAGNNIAVRMTSTAAAVVYAWGAQLEAQPFATSYIPTVATSVTRAGDVLFPGGTMPATLAQSGCERMVFTPQWTSSVPWSGSRIMGFADGTNLGLSMYLSSGTAYGLGFSDSNGNTSLLNIGWAARSPTAVLSEWSVSQNLRRLTLLPNVVSTQQVSGTFPLGFAGTWVPPSWYMESVFGWVSDLQFGSGPGQCSTNAPVPYFIALGDSITTGFGVSGITIPFPSRIAAVKSKAFINAGIAGDTIANMATRWATTLAGKNPTVLVLHGGINDLLASASAATVSANITALHDAAHAAGVKTVVISLLPCSGYTGGTCVAGVQANITTVNATLAAYASAHPTNTTLVDANLLLRDPGATNALLAAYDSGDHLHPNQVGMDIIGNAVAAVIP